MGVSARQGPHQGAQKSTSTGTRREASITSCSKVAAAESKDEVVAIVRGWGRGRRSSTLD
jgi:hypothetical protein